MDKLHNGEGEPPSRNGSQSCFLVGKDNQGHWAVRDQKGLRGGIFVDRAQALKYAMHEITDRMQAVIMVPGVLELDMRIGRHVSKLAGFAPALPTPFDADDLVDTAAFERLCALQVSAGATALVVCGTTGEAPTLSSEEHRRLIRIAASVARGLPVIAGAGSNSTAHAIELTKIAEAAGADAVMSVVPYYNKPTQAGLHAHFTAIAQSTDLPIFLYDVPSRTACGLADATVSRLVPKLTGRNLRAFDHAP